VRRWRGKIPSVRGHPSASLDQIGQGVDKAKVGMSRYREFLTKKERSNRHTRKPREEHREQGKGNTKEAGDSKLDEEAVSLEKGCQ